MSSNTPKQAIRLITKSLWKSGAEELYKTSIKRTSHNHKSVFSTCNPTQRRTYANESVTAARSRSHANPMLNGVSMLQWFFDEVRPDEREVRYWMKYFSQATDPRKPFAVIQLSEDVFRQEEQEQRAKEKGDVKRTILETLSLSMYFLQENKMNVILLVGCSTSSPHHQAAREQISKNIRKLVDRLEESGTHSTPIFDGGHLFNTDQNFRIESLNTPQLDWLIRHANIPVIGCVGESCEGRLGTIQLDESTLSLSAYTKPLKVLMLNADGGIKDDTGQRVTTVFLPKESELQKFAGQPWWNPDVEDRFTKVWGMLKVLPKQSSYVITSARDVLTELLTQRGVGTMFKRVVPVKKYKSLQDPLSDGQAEPKILLDVLPALVASAFEKSASKSYWNLLPADLDAVYLTDDVKACAIVRHLPMMPGVAYLDKFAVSREERGNFNIEILWQQLKHDYKSLFWRSRHDNIFNNWYEARSDGVVKVGYYHIFWFGLSSADINTIVTQCKKLPDSFDGERLTIVK
ncbi:N-acetylglutamate synthase, mitochondrial-like [Watersipora subatra]|uniref:N-acetylglutamate synthase, mitochondrial-like n=1 Tax=Watersipora subatra TaxID=2589382 RepID=UPI00355B2501